MDDYLSAGSPLLSLMEAMVLSQHASARVRCKLAANPRCSHTVLHALANDPNVEVRAAVGQNLCADAELIDKLIEDESIAVRFQLAGNPNIGNRRLEQLMNDTNPYIAERAWATFETKLLEAQLTKFNLPELESKPLLGQLLLKAGLISQENLDAALQEAKNLGLLLGNLLLMRRLSSRYVLVEALLVQHLIGQKRLSFDEGVYFVKRESKIDTCNIFRPKVQSELYEAHA